MKKGRLLFLVALSVISLIIIFHSLTFFVLTEKNYNKMMCYYIARSITADSSDFDSKIRAIRDFVHQNVHPIPGYYNRLDTVAIDKLLSGIGWCDQQARVFMQLSSPIGITTRLIFLRLNLGSSPHTVSEALSPDNRWVIVDVAYKLDLLNPNGAFATQSDIKKDLKIVSENKRVKMRALFENRWADSNYLVIYHNPPLYIVTKKGMTFDPLRRVPISWIRPFANIIQNIYLAKRRHDIKDIYEFKMLKARGLQLLSYYKECDRLYNDIITNSDNLLIRRTAEYYLALALKEEKRYEEAGRYITGVINRSRDNPYLQYLYALRSSILEKMGRHKEAEDDLLKIEYSLDA